MRAGVAVVRLSGAHAFMIAKKLCTGLQDAPRQAQLHGLKAPDTGAALDKALVLYFKAPASFTGEDVVEFHLHGGRAVIEGVASALEIAGAKPAQAGEFTKRAFENGKLDLTEAEAIADLIDAQTQAQRDQALAQLGGALAVLYGGWSEKLSKTLAHIEADIEFPDEDLPQGVSDAQLQNVRALLQEIDAHLNDDRRGEILRDGVKVAIIGAPNAGKSTLLNALAQREAAIVSDEAGTTRDVVEVRLNLGGYPVIIWDTAGLRETDNKIEAEGIKRAKAHAQDADLKIALYDVRTGKDAHTQALEDEKTLVVFNKCDAGEKPADGFAISAKTGAGMDVFLKALAENVRALLGTNGAPALTRARHRQALEETKEALARALQAPLPELCAEDLRLALRALGRITGRVHVEELLDKIFRDFCIGK